MNKHDLAEQERLEVARVQARLAGAHPDWINRYRNSEESLLRVVAVLEGRRFTHLDFTKPSNPQGYDREGPGRF